MMSTFFQRAILFIVVVFALFISNTQSQPLSQAELDSVIWIIQQYKVNAPMDQTLCNMPSWKDYFVCSGGHLTDLRNLPGTQIETNGMPNANLVQLTLPELKTILINQVNFTVADPAQSLYDKLPTSCPKLEMIQLMGDPSMTNFPNNFDLIAPTTLQTVTISLPYHQSIKLPSHPLVSILEVYGSDNATEFVIDDTVLLPKATLLGFGIPNGGINNNNLQSIGNFTAKSFPALTALYPSLLFSTPPVQLNIDVPTLTTLVFQDGGQVPPNTIVHFNSTQWLTDLTYFGTDTTFNPGLTTFQNLKSVTVGKYTSPLYPFSQGYPPNIVSVNLPLSSISTITPTPIPSSATSLDLTGSQVAMPIDFNTILQNTTGNLVLNLQNNVPLSGPLDLETSLCKLKLLNLGGTGVTKIPDCFWCYKNEPTTRFVVPALVVIPGGFNCPITFESTNIATIFKKAIIKGKNLGWGASVGGNTLVAIVPNEQIEATLPGVVTDGIPQTIDIQFSNDYPTYKFPFNVVEAGFIISTTTANQSPDRVMMITVTFSTVNTFINHYASINGVLSTTNSNVGSTYQFGFLDLPFGTYNVNISNDYYSIIAPNVECTQSYPIVNTIVPDPVIKSGSNIQFNGIFGTYLTSSSVTIQNSNSQYNYSVCSITEFTTTRISCKVESPISSGLATFNITVDGYSILEQFTIQSAQQQCESITNHCANNGVCTPDGVCVCNVNQGGYYNNCSKPYPFATSGQVNDQNTTQRSISLFGDFGPNALTNSSVRINNTMNCIIDQLESTQFTIQCQLESSPTIYGPASVQLNVDGYLFDSKTYLIRFIKPSTGGSTTSLTTSVPTTSGGETPKSPKEICSETTQYCFGHGTCDDNGICQCQSGFNPVDNCLTKFADNTTYVPNPESPSTNISVDGVEFGFDIVAIQEIGLDNEIVKELLTNSWISNITTNNTFTDAVYQLVISNTSILADTQVTVNITFSTQSRSITFGNQQLLINPNSIKLAVSINGWEYSSNVATLRVVLKTTTNNQQSIEYDCKETDISSFSYDDYGTLQYLRVLKDNVQFNGRFIDFALADGRTTYSQTLLINQTQINSNQSSTMIGITLPQCQSCVLDPDFTPLLVVNDKDGGDCSSSDDQKWKIIVGCVVGGIGCVAIAVGSTIYYKKAMRTKKYNKQMEAKLRSL
ncbi:hypothetical protein DFA_05169 [Cavenderia fasciculata]|uniref:EGF-like domain-containing protein n=1 Tax=Cavenderia fasciculata TaxID=261658 RepID=F4PNI6_CACFS|nr:uncharacterized protein DFA_05169 [Cavenderia fasciculata]EGG23039.1 hypothetical protein DFA_05169 [Cavenderia fasciculata]|eukprot:XP_004360890.1 hypothetical protein DFA_05169 [Cavenderia fasciculata]